MILRRTATVPVVDAHHHLWRYTTEEYSWIDDRMALLRRDFTAADLQNSMAAAGVDLSVAVQARQSLEETRALLETAKSEPRIAGVVGWLPLADPRGLAAALDQFSADPLLVGARHVVQDEPKGFFDDEDFNRGIRALTAAGLAYDLLIRADQLPEATRFVDRHPQQRFTLDHIAKPAIKEGLLDPWRSQIRELARREHVCCKISGMVTEAAWDKWSPERLRPYLDVVVDAFGPARLLAGSDWPVCLVACGYGRWWQTLRSYFAEFTSAEQHAIFGGNAASFYRLAL